jgi:hypothetical protein
MRPEENPERSQKRVWLSTSQRFPRKVAAGVDVAVPRSTSK